MWLSPSSKHMIFCSALNILIESRDVAMIRMTHAYLRHRAQVYRSKDRFKFNRQRRSDKFEYYLRWNRFNTEEKKNTFTIQQQHTPHMFHVFFFLVS